MKRVFTWIIFTSICIVLFNNCGKPQHSPLIDSSLLPLDAEEDVPPESLKLISNDTFMNCDEDHVQVGGICHPGESRINYIEISMTREGAPISFGEGSEETFKLKNAVCENGRFFAVIPRPNDPRAPCIGSNSAPEYRVLSQIYVSDEGSQYRAGAKGTSFPMRVQLVGACTGQLSCSSN